MAGPLLKAKPIVVDYQSERHEADERRKSNADHGDDTSGAFILFVWALSAGLFLTGFYVASEAPLRDESGGRADKVAGVRHGLAMTQGRAPRRTAATNPEALAGTHSETRR